MERAPQGNEEEVDQSRRGFLRGLGALGAATVAGGVIYEASKVGEEEGGKEHAIPGIIHPWEGKSLEDLSWKELTDEIEDNIEREVAMSRLDEVADPLTALPQVGELRQEGIAYFLEPYTRMHQKPSHDAVHEELLILRDRIHTGRAEREKRRAEGRAN